jgi:RNA polymerase sigma-70 factor (ECF subfamily)
MLPSGESPKMHVELEPPTSADAWEGPWPQSREEFAGLVEMYLDRLVHYAFRRLGSMEDAEDVVQEVFVRAFADRSRRKRTFAVAPYLYRCVANACTDLVRRRKHSAKVRGQIAAEGFSDLAGNPPEVALAAEELCRAEALLGRLPEAQAEVVRLRVFDELRLSEIAAIVGCSVNTVCSRLRYGFRKLRNLVSEKQE